MLPPPDAEQPQTPDPAISPGAGAAGLVPRDPAARATEVIEAPLAAGGVVPRASDRPGLPPALTAAPNVFTLLQALRRRWLLALSLATLFAVLAAGVTWQFVAPAKYQASAFIRINSQHPRILWELRESKTDWATFQRNQVELIRKARFVLITALRQPQVASLPTVQEHEHPVDWLAKEIEVELLPNSELMRVALRGDRPQDLADIVNAVVKAYLEEVIEKDKQARVKRMEVLEGLYSKFQDDMHNRQAAWKNLAQQAGAPDPKIFAAKQSAAWEELSGARSQLRSLRLQLIQMRAEEEAGPKAGVVQPAAATVDPDLEEWLEKDHTVQTLQKRIEELEEGLARTKALSAQPTNRVIRDLTEQLARAKASLAERRQKLTPSFIKAVRNGKPRKITSPPSQLAQERSALQRAEDMLKQDIKSLTTEIERSNDKALMMEQVHEEVLRTQNLSRELATELDKFKIEKHAPPRAESVVAAEAPRLKDTDRQVKMTAVAGSCSFLFVLLGVALVEFRARRITGTDEGVRGLGLRLVGAVPALPGRARRAGGGSPDPYWHNLMTESVDAARTLLLHAARANGLRVVMVTSALPGEGKTSLTTQLATSLARAGRKALLLDCDLRKPAVHRLLGLPLDRGISEVLRGDADITEVVRPTQAPGLSFVSAGACDPAALQALAQEDLRGLFDLLRAEYDFIVVDTSPVLCVTDALLLGQCADGVLFSILRDVSRLPTVHAACERLEALNVNVLGAVVNGVRGNAYGPAYSGYLNGPTA